MKITFYSEMLSNYGTFKQLLMEENTPGYSVTHTFGGKKQTNQL